MDVLTVAAAVAAVAGFGLARLAQLRALRAEAQVTALGHELQAERHAASHDALTGLPNRRAFYRLGADLLAAPPGQYLVAVVLDLDDFKQINDRFGHAAGDEVLIAVAQRFSAYARGRLVARLGGDEFAALITGPTDDETWLRYAAHRLTELVAAPMQIAGRLVTVTASVGLAPVPAGAALSEALRRADAAMYRAKGRDRATGRDGTKGRDRDCRTILRADPDPLDLPALDPVGPADPDMFEAAHHLHRPPAARHPPAPPATTRQLVDTTQRTDSGGP